jgi:alkylation response protein AidB-like acyl-CoA dehydrogenase
MIDLIPTDEQGAIAEGVAAYLRDAFPLERYRSGGGGDTDARWRELAALGAFGVSAPEAAGGVGLGLVEDILVFREFGRRLVSPAALGTRLAACAAAAAGETELARAFLEGQRRAGLATATAGGWQLLAAGDGDHGVLVTGGALQLFAPDSIVERSPRQGLDPTVAISRATLRGPPLLSSADPGLVLSAGLLAAAMLCGLLEAARDMAADYAKTRQQFGSVIGVFQGVKHRCADMALAAEAAWSQTCYAGLMVEAGQPDARFHAAAAKLLAGEGALDACRGAIQIFGGMGFTDEVDAQLLLKRAHVLHQLFEDPRTLPAALLDMPLNL